MQHTKKKYLNENLNFKTLFKSDLLLKDPLHQKSVVVFEKSFFFWRFATWTRLTQFVDVVVALYEVVSVDTVQKFWSSQVFLF